MRLGDGAIGLRSAMLAARSTISLGVLGTGFEPSLRFDLPLVGTKAGVVGKAVPGKESSAAKVVHWRILSSA